MNVLGYENAYQEFTRFVENVANDETNDLRAVGDQGLFKRFFPMSRSWDLYALSDLFFQYSDYKAMFSKYHSSLLPKIFEWEPYLGINDEAVIIHFHGPKFNIESCSTNYSQMINLREWTNELEDVLHFEALGHNVEGYYYYAREMFMGHVKTVCAGQKYLNANSLP